LKTKNLLFSGIPDGNNLNEKKADESLDSFLDSKFKTLDGKFEDLKKKNARNPLEEGVQKDQMIDTFMKDYNSQFRQKSLMQLNQEMKKQKDREGEQKERRSFDRTLDLGQAANSKQILKVLGNKDFSLGSRFENAKSGNKYL